MQDTYLRYRVGLLSDWEHCEYFEEYKIALSRYNQLAPTFDNVHLVELVITERVIDDILKPLPPFAEW